MTKANKKLVEQQEPEKLPEHVLDAFGKVIIHECSICGSFIGDKEWKEFEGVCSKHWDN